MKKADFVLNDYDFKIVKMEVFNKKDKSENVIDYFLLVDSNNLVHDFKVYFHQIYLTRFTTPSHIKSTDPQLRMRKRFLKELGLENSFEEQDPKQYTLINDKTTIDKINNWSFNNIWNDIQFQQVEYLIKGSNSSGQGNGRGYLNIIVENKPKPFGFFMQELNVYKKLKKIYNNVDYSEIWKQYNSFYDLNINSISFSKWLNSDSKIRNLFFDFMNDPGDWKDISKIFKQKFANMLVSYDNLEIKVAKYRNEFKKNIEKTYKKYNSITKIFFKNVDTTHYELAHIKPVWYIKEEYKKSNFKKEEILEQIKDINNFLPLSPTVHSLYDKYYFYWDEKGMLQSINKDLKINDIEGYEIIEFDYLGNVKKYLKQYQELLKSKNKI